MKYYTHIDGLRAISILLILFYHAGFTSFKYGYIGVDIFFVISGYLITLSIANDSQFTFKGFYERRIRRILPALFSMCFICSGFAWVLLTPKELNDFGRSLFASVNMFSNFYFWLTQNYHDQISQLKPLIHTWSLSVEEQFYILFPALFVYAKKKDCLISTIVICAIISFSFQITTLHLNREVISFYFPMSRAWEFLIGVLGALPNNKQSRRDQKYISSVMANLGLIVILASCFYPINSPNIIQNIAASIGAIFVILYSNKSNFSGKILNISLLRLIGISSYSIYLFHQPIFAFYRHISNKDNDEVLLLLAILSIAIGFLSFIFIEKLFKEISKKILFRSLLALWILLSALGLSFQYFDGFPLRFTPEQQQVLNYEHYDYKSALRSDLCLIGDNHFFSKFPIECYGPSPNNETTLLWGDSHAAALYSGFSKFRNNLSQFSTTSCPPLIDEIHLRSLCNKSNKWVLNEIGKIKPKEVFLVADWSSYNQISLNSLHSTINKIRENSPETKITIIGNTPHWYPSLPIYIIKYISFYESENHYATPFELKKSLDSDLSIQSQASQLNVNFISALNFMCKGNVCKFKIFNGNNPHLMFYDSEHLTSEGSLFLATKIYGKLDK